MLPICHLGFFGVYRLVIPAEKKARQLSNQVEELPGHSPPPASGDELVMLDMRTPAPSLAVTTPTQRPERLFHTDQNPMTCCLRNSRLGS